MAHRRSCWPASPTLPIVAPKNGVTEPGSCARLRRASFHVSVRVFLRSFGDRPSPDTAVSTTGTKLPSVSAISTATPGRWRSEEHTSELQSHLNLVCRLLLEK